jgi:hypothetical protein
MPIAASAQPISETGAIVIPSECTKFTMFTPVASHPTTVVSVFLGHVRSRRTAAFALLSPRTIFKEWPIATWSQWRAAGGVGLMPASLLLRISWSYRMRCPLEPSQSSPKYPGRLGILSAGLGVA